MELSDLLFYNEYENFYTMTKSSSAFKKFCEKAFGKADYSDEKFDVITSMDTMYFAPDMSAFIDQIMRWLKKDGIFFVGYQEGDVMPKTENQDTTVFAKALIEKNSS